MQNALQQFGMSERQSRIYLELRNHGGLTAAELARQTGIPRVSVYSCIEDLQRQGIVTRLKKNRRQLYEAQAPELLLESFQKRMSLFESAMPFLSALGPGIADKFSVRLYEGEEQSRQGQRDFYECLTEEKVKTVQSISHPDLAKAFPRFLPQMVQRRRQMGISTRLIVPLAHRGATPSFYGEGKGREMRYLPGKFPFNCTCVNGGQSTLFIITQHKSPIVLLIRSESVSSVISACFSFIWENLGPSENRAK